MEGMLPPALWPRFLKELAYYSLAMYGWHVMTKWLFMALDFSLNLFLTGSPTR